MAEQPSYEHGNADVYSMYVRRRSRLRFELSKGSLHDAFVSMHSDEARGKLGQGVLFLYSDYQIDQYRPKSKEARDTEAANSELTRKLAPLKSHQYKPTRWIQPVRPDGKDETHFRMNFIIDVDTQRALHESVVDDLEQTKIGRKTITAALVIPDKDIVSKHLRLASSREIRAALWADDPDNANMNPLKVAYGQKNYVTGIDWISHVQA